MSEGSTFATEGFLSDEAEEGRGSLVNSYAIDFHILKDANRLIQKIASELDPSNSQRERIANILGVRFCQNLQSSVILLSYGINSDAYSIIRNMQECYLALACLLKDENHFMNLGGDDRVKFNNGMIKHIEKSHLVSGLYQEFKDKIENVKIITEEELKSLNTKSRTDAKTFYDFTHDEWQSDLVYMNYKHISNCHGHISFNSLSHHVKKTDSGWAVHWRTVTQEEIRSATKHIIDTVVFFGKRLDAEFLLQRYDGELTSLQEDLYKSYMKIGAIVHKDDLPKCL